MARDEAGSAASILLYAFIALGAVVTFGAVLSHMMTLRITQSIGDLASAANAISQGDLNSRLNVLSHDELGEFAQTFNAMVA